MNDFNSLNFVYSNNCKSPEEWKHEGGTILQMKDIGCGVNVLTYLNLISREKAEGMVSALIADLSNTSGTSFVEMLNEVQKSIPDPLIKLEEYKFDFQDDFKPIGDISIDKVERFFRLLLSKFPNRSCVMAKLNRPPSMRVGHSVVFHISNNSVFTVDPQQDTLRLSYTSSGDRVLLEKVVASFAFQKFTSVSLGMIKPVLLHPGLNVVKITVPQPPPQQVETKSEIVEPEVEANPEAILDFMKRYERMLSEDFSNHLNLVSNEIESNINDIMYSQDDIMLMVREETAKYRPISISINTLKRRLDQGENIILNEMVIGDYMDIMASSKQIIKQSLDNFQSLNSSNNIHFAELNKYYTDFELYRNRINDAVNEMKKINNISSRNILIRLETLLTLVNNTIKRIENSNQDYINLRNEIELNMEQISSSEKNLKELNLYSSL
jgi:hypothetical protein